MVPPVWVRRGFSTFLCTRKLGRKMTGGISVMVATAKDHCGDRRRPLASHCCAQSSEAAAGKADSLEWQFQGALLNPSQTQVLWEETRAPPVQPPRAPGPQRAVTLSAFLQLCPPRSLSTPALHSPRLPSCACSESCRGLRGSLQTWTQQPHRTGKGRHGGSPRNVTQRAPDRARAGGQAPAPRHSAASSPPGN